MVPRAFSAAHSVIQLFSALNLYGFKLRSLQSGSLDCWDWSQQTSLPREILSLNQEKLTLLRAHRNGWDSAPSLNNLGSKVLALDHTFLVVLGSILTVSCLFLAISCFTSTQIVQQFKHYFSFKCSYFDFSYLIGELPASQEALKNEKPSIGVTCTRKSLVKGERFIRGWANDLNAKEKEIQSSFSDLSLQKFCISSPIFASKLLHKVV